MRYQVLILTADTLFGRMLQLEFVGWHLTAGLAAGLTGECADVAVVDLDSAPVPPEGDCGYLIGFSRLPALSADEEARRCAMILRRPFRMSLLRQEVLSHLGAALPEPRQVPQAPRSLTLTTDGVQYGDRSVSLTPTERALTDALLQAGGEPVPRATLEALLRKPGKGKLEVYLCSVRRKLRSTGIPAEPEPVRGVGYRLIFPEKS